MPEPQPGDINGIILMAIAVGLYLIVLALWDRRH